jgi:hypothetical protein
MLWTFCCHNLTMKTLYAILALLAVSVIVGQAGAEHHTAVEVSNVGQSLPSHSAPAQVLVRACGNCHSNNTEWPWYSHVALVSWWIARDVREGRNKLDFSRWQTYSAKQKRDKSESACGLITTGRMPPWLYSAMHPEAKLTPADKNAVCTWAKAQDESAR